MPGLVLGASFLGFGSLVRESGLSLWVALAISVTNWALPGQVALVELWAAGASLVAIILAVALTNARLLPMTVVLMPWLREEGGVIGWRHYLASHLIAVTSWANAMQALPAVAPRDRFVWFVAFAGTLCTIALAATGAGYVLAGLVPKSVTLALVFINPAYFLLVLVGDLRQRARVFALAAGALLGPLFHLLNPDWGLLATGLAAGTVALVLDRLLGRRARGGDRA